MGAAPPTSDAPTSATEREIFLAALDLPSSERAAYLDRACGQSPVLRTSVEALLALHREDTFLETPVIAPPRTGSDTPRIGPAGSTANAAIPGQVIGRYKLLEQIGEGGAGTVFMAEQVEPVRRRVALKLIKAGMDTRSVIARFETERQALALMDHPNIARVLDAGSTDAGRPYFVMELVRGTRLTEYCDEEQLPTHERLRLFIQVCHAIQHAHQKGIIHRDIKPSNILVTLHDGVPVPKVIDFGIAKAIDQRLTDKTVFTAFHAFIGTPAYMSPEQAEMSGLDIDTRTDVYSLGVLLYEVLTGHTPFDSQELLASGFDAMRRTICEREPLAPSTRLRTMGVADRTTTATRQRTEPGRLVTALRGDLDWIVLKALEKDRSRRYETASDLAQDVQRYLDSEPVLARPPSAVYRLQKLARRHRVAVVASVAFSLAMVLGLALTFWQYLEKSAALLRAQSAELTERGLREAAQRAEAAETRLRRLAETQELRARQTAYAADINLAQHALSRNNLGRAQQLLDRQRPNPGQADLRGWEWRYLWQQCRSEALFSLPAHSNRVFSISVSGDGHWLAAADSGGRVVVTDLRSREAIARFDGNPGAVFTGFSPARTWLAFNAYAPGSQPGPQIRPRSDRSPGSGFGGDQDQRLRIWDVASRRFLHELPLGGTCRGLWFSGDGQRLLAATEGRLLKWNLPDMSPAGVVPLPDAPRFPGAIAVSADQELVAYSMSSGRLRVLELASGRIRWTAEAADESVRALAFSPDNRVLASGAGFVESAIRLWDTTSGAEIERLEGHRTWVSSLVFWPDGSRLASASADQTIRLWDLTDLQANAAGRRPSGSDRPEPIDPVSDREIGVLRGHRLEVWSLALAPDRSTLVSGSKDGAVCFWDTHRARGNPAYRTLPDPVRAWVFAPDSRSIVTLDREGRVHRWYGQDFQDHHVALDLPREHFFARFSRDARLLATVGPGRLSIWDLERQSVLRSWEGRDHPGFPLGFLPGSARILTRQFPAGNVQEWDVTTGALVRTWPDMPSDDGPGDIALAPTGDRGLFIGPGGQAYLLDPERPPRGPFDLGVTQANAIFANDGSHFVLIGQSGQGAVWEASGPSPIAGVSGFLQAMRSAVYSPDNRRLVIGSDGREALKLWDTASYDELLTLGAEGSGFEEPLFSPDGHVLGARNGAGRLFFWTAPSLEEIALQEAAGR